MIVEDAGFDAACINTDVKKVFTDVEPLVGKILRDAPCFLKNIGSGRQYEAGIGGTSDAFDETGKIGIFRRKRVFIKCDPSEKIIEKEYLLFYIDDGSKSIVEAADRHKFPALTEIGVREHLGQGRFSDAGRPGDDEDML